MANFDFNKIRPYYDCEINDAMGRIVDAPDFPYFASKTFPNISIEDSKEIFQNIHTVDSFQETVMYALLTNIIKNTSDSLVTEGMDILKPSDSYLFISNHRDIALDAAILQYILYENNIPSSEITIGDNLLENKLFNEIVKSNRMVIAIRGGGSMRECLFNSQRLSEYIRNKVIDQHRSLWISQRNGRTKDGNDKTEVGLLKMLNLSGKHDVINNFCELNIIPLAISYQYEPCDFLKTRELFISRRTKYIKQKNEDFNSVMTGLKTNKGNICFSFKQLPNLSDALKNGNNNQFFKIIASIIDKTIYSAYKLWNTNYIAFDLLNNDNSFCDLFYSVDEKHSFIDYMESGLHELNFDSDYEEIKDIFLRIYANPVINKNICYDNK